MVLKGLMGKGPPKGQSKGQRPGKGKAPCNATPAVNRLLRECFERFRLANVENFCFINAALLATLWATLSTTVFTMSQWGQHVSEMIEFLQILTDDLFILFLCLVSRW